MEYNVTTFNKIKSRSSNALTGEGLEDGINWLVDKLTHTK